MTKDCFNEAEPLWLFGKPSVYTDPDASNMELCDEFIQMRCDGDLNIAQARALRDWLNRVLPNEPPSSECICPTCGLRHGGSKSDGGF